METKTKRHSELDKKLIKVVNKALFTQKAEPFDCAKVLFLFGELIKNEEEFILAIKIFENDYPFLKEILRTEEEELKEDKEKIVEDFIRESIKKDPSLASKIGEYISKNKNFSLDELKKMFPDFNEFISKEK